MTESENVLTPDWVKECVSRVPHRRQLHSPLLFDWNGEPWTAATNGHRLGAVRGACSDAQTPETMGASGSLYPNIAGVLKRPTDLATRRRVVVAELREWFGSNNLNPDCNVCHGKGKESCADCDGEGTVECECHCGDEHDRECKRCKGKGTWVCPQCLPNTREIDRAKMFGITFDRHILRPVLAKLPYEWCYFHSNGDNATWFYDDSDAWLLLLMPLRGDPALDKDVPVFTPREQAAA